MNVRVIEATRHPGGGGGEVVRLVVHFSTDAGASVGYRTVDVPAGTGGPAMRAAVQAAWQELAGATVAALVGQEWTF